jgi:hypothetical protein
MPIIASDKGGSDFEPIPAGSHQAVCYGVVDIGTQMSNNPQFKDARKVCILWELPQERGDFKDKKDPNKTVNLPRAISNIYTLSLGDKANLRKVLESWRAKAFTREELDGFDITKLLGANCMLSIVHKAGGGKNTGKIYANVAGVSALPKGMTKANRENSSLMFSLNDFTDGSVTFPENLPEWLRTLINQSKEMSDNHGQQQPPPAASASDEELGEDVPF